jgi:hypothetical protein
MKAERVVTTVLGALVILLSIILLFKKEKPSAETPKEIWHTNTVEIWRTNSVVQWRTNTIELWRTNLVSQQVTNEVVREIPARLSDAVKAAAILGYKYGKAPTIAPGSDLLYKATPVSLQIQVQESAKDLLSKADINALHAEGERTLRSHNIPITRDSPYQLRLLITSVWSTDVPGMASCILKLELREDVVAMRQSNAVKFESVAWSSTRLGTALKGDAAGELSRHIQAQIEQFCADAARAKGREQAIEAALPKVPDELLGQPE